MKIKDLQDVLYSGKRTVSKIQPENVIKELLQFEDSKPIERDGEILWILPNGEKHRKFGPAAIYPNGDEYWYYQGKLHRDDGPAIEQDNGTKYWYKKGKLHREDGPAVIYPNGDEHWYYKGKLHRNDGPAIECTDGKKIYYVHGSPMSAYDYEIRYEYIKNGIPHYGPNLKD